MPCDENAMCEELPRQNNFTCTCIPPYMGDGFMCSRGEYAQTPAVRTTQSLCIVLIGIPNNHQFNNVSNSSFMLNIMSDSNLELYFFICGEALNDNLIVPTFQ